MKKALVVLLLTMPAFASTHFVGRTLEPTAKLAHFGAKASVHVAKYPVRHPVSTSKGVAKGVAATAKAVF